MLNILSVSYLQTDEIVTEIYQLEDGGYRAFARCVWDIDETYIGVGEGSDIETAAKDSQVSLQLELKYNTH